MNCPTYHIPVLLHETVDGLSVSPDGVYVDVTFGGGGHSREILRRLGADGHLYSFDQDADAEANVPEGEERLTFVRSNFRYITNWMRYHGQFDADGTGKVDGVLADLGVSSHHFDAEERGFSFRYDAPLDMRMNGRGGQTAADVLCKAGAENECATRRRDRGPRGGQRDDSAEIHGVGLKDQGDSKSFSSKVQMYNFILTNDELFRINAKKCYFFCYITNNL